MANLAIENILAELKSKVSVQSYSPKPAIEGVKVIELKKWQSEDGTFEEVVRLNEQGGLELFPEFHLKQFNRSTIMPGAVKAWHLHYKQEDIWYVPFEDHVLLGLWDVREGSATKNVKMRIVLGAGAAKLVYIPRGVAHGVANVSPNKATVFYLVNQLYNLQDPDEQRLPWDAAGQDFWEAERG